MCREEEEEEEEEEDGDGDGEEDLCSLHRKNGFEMDQEKQKKSRRKKKKEEEEGRRRRRRGMVPREPHFLHMVMAPQLRKKKYLISLFFSVRAFPLR